MKREKSVHRPLLRRIFEEQPVYLKLISVGISFLSSTYLLNLTYIYFNKILISYPFVFLLGGFYLFIFIFPYTLIILSIIKVLNGNRNKNEQLLEIFVSYFSIIILFTGVYYSIGFFHDYNRSIDEHFGYSTPAAFEGFNHRLITHGEIEYSEEALQNHLTSSEYLSKARTSNLEIENAISFQNISVNGAIVDSFYLSVTSMTLFGYGSIQPLSTLARLTNSFQLLTAVFILIIAFGMLFSNWWKFSK